MTPPLEPQPLYARLVAAGLLLVLIGGPAVVLLGEPWALPAVILAGVLGLALGFAAGPRP